MHKILTFLFLFCAFAIQAQVQISGKIITDTDSEGAIGATVQLKGSTIGTTADLDGNYTISIPSREGVLVFSYTGYSSQEIPVTSASIIDIVLSENASKLNEVVVVGYGTQKRSNISGSVSSVGAEELAEKPILRVEQALQGRAAGVQVAQTSGSPGAGLTVRIRGTGTINNSDPLYIVDGMPVENVDFLNPNDVESMNILKDGAASAIYGSRGANGVVIITTKGSKVNQEGSISYDVYYGIQRPRKLLELLTASEYATIQNEAYIAAGRAPLPEFANPAALGRGTDWQEAIFGNAPISSNQLTFRGGSAKSSYSLSGNHFNQEGIIGGDKTAFQRSTIRLNARNEIKNWLAIGNNLGYTRIKRRTVLENSQYNSPLIRALNMDPVTPVYKQDGTFAYSQYADTDIANPVNTIAQTFGGFQNNRFVGGAYAEMKVLPGLTFRSSPSFDITFAENNGFSPYYDLSSVPELSEAPAAEKNLINGVGITNSRWTNWQWENVLNYSTKVADQHDLEFIAGTTALKNRGDISGGGNTNLPSNDPNDAYIGNTVSPIESQTAFQYAYESTLLSYFGKVNYGFDDRYLASATFRADGSSKFGKNNRFGYFPSFSAAWIASHEDFWNSNVVNYLKVRASWGQNGSDRIGAYDFSTVVTNGQNYSFGPNETITNGAVALSSANPDLKWETSTQTDIGVDLEFLEGRVSFTSDYFVKKTTDMLYRSPIPLIAGTAPPVQNVATAENRGLEIAASYRNFDRAFRYEVGGNITFIQSEVTGLGLGGDPVLSGYVQSANANAAKTDVGHPAASFFGYVTDGIFQNQAEVEAHAFQNEGTRPGDIRFKDLNDDGVIDILDRDYIGNPTPNIVYGFNTDFSWKNIELNLFWQGTYGNDIYNNTTRFDFAYVNRPASVLNRWTGEGTSNTEPRVSLSDPNLNARVSDRFVEDGSYFRLKNVQLAYNLPKSMISKARFKKIKVYMTASNLITFTKYSGYDPEIGSIGSLELGIDRGFYPQARTIQGGVSAEF